MHIVIYILNMVQVRVNQTKAPYELWHRRSPTVKYFRIFRSNYYIIRDEEDLGQFDAIFDEGILFRIVYKK